MVIVGCCKQQLQLQGLQNTCCPFQLSLCNVGSMRSRRTSTSSCSDGAGLVVMSLLFRPCCSFSASACKQVRVVNIGCSSNGGGSSNSVRSRRRSSRFVCMVADERNSLRQQQQEQQEQQARSLLVLQQHKGELLSPVEEDKDVEEEEEHEEEVMTQGSVFPSSSDAIDFASSVASAAAADATAMADRRSKQRKRERTAYLFAAITSSIGFVTLAAGAVYYRFIWQMQGSGEVPYAEMLGTFSLAIGAAVGMEFWARWAHRALWHASLWNMHESHHKAREGPFELNDIFAIINAVPAITLMAFGFFNHGFVPGLCFGGVSKYTEHNCCSKLTLQNLSNVLPGKFSFLANLFNIL
jgi:hypothetical protein